MAHFAKVLNGTVIDVIVAESDFFDSFTDSSPGNWIQTSYNTRGGIHYDPDTNLPSEDQTKALRKNYAAIGFIYDTTRDAFYPPQPYPSWTLDEDTCWWHPPVPAPSDENIYTWNEQSQTWDQVDG